MILLTDAEVCVPAHHQTKPLCHQGGVIHNGVPRNGRSHFSQQGCLCSSRIECKWPRIPAQLADRPRIYLWFITTSWALCDIPRGPLLSDAPILIFSISASGNKISSLQHFVTLLREFWFKPVPVAEGWGFIIPKYYTCGSGLFCLNMLPDYFLTYIGLSYLIHSESFNQGKEKKKDPNDRKSCKSWCYHKSMSLTFSCLWHQGYLFLLLVSQDFLRWSLAQTHQPQSLCWASSLQSELIYSSCSQSFFLLCAREIAN